MLGSVPIVWGLNHIEDYELTNHSIIKVSDFHSIKELGDYINYLNSNDTAYNEYLSYKKLIIFGAEKSGKTCLSKSLEGSPFSESLESDKGNFI